MANCRLRKVGSVNLKQRILTFSKAHLHHVQCTYHCPVILPWCNCRGIGTMYLFCFLWNCCHHFICRFCYLFLLFVFVVVVYFFPKYLFYKHLVGTTRKWILSEWFLLITFQFGYNSSASNYVRLSKVEDWGGLNIPKQDKDPEHADIVILLTGWVRTLLLVGHPRKTIGGWTRWGSVSGFQNKTVLSLWKD